MTYSCGAGPESDSYWATKCRHRNPQPIEVLAVPETRPSVKTRSSTEYSWWTRTDERNWLADTLSSWTLTGTDFFSEEDIDDFLPRLEKLSPTLVTLLQPALDELKNTIQYATTAGVSRPILFHPLMLGTHHNHFKDGILVEVVRRNKRTDVLAAGGRWVFSSILAALPLTISLFFIKVRQFDISPFPSQIPSRLHMRNWNPNCRRKNHCSSCILPELIRQDPNEGRTLLRILESPKVWRLCGLISPRLPARSLGSGFLSMAA